MADNLSIDPGTTTPVATDDEGGVHYQKVKLVDGTSGQTTAIAAGGGVEAGALRVTIASDSTGVVSVDDGGGALTVDGTVAVTNAGITTIAGAVAGTEMQVDVVGALPAGTALLGKVGIDQATANANEVVVKSCASHAVTNAGTFAVQAAATLAAETTKVIGTVNIAAAQTVGLAAGTAGIGKLTANSGTDIGDVDVLTVTPGTAAANLGKAEDAGHTSGDVGVMALAVRNDTPAALAGTTADYIPLTTDKLGAVWVTQRAATPYKNIDCDESEDAVSANPCRLMGFYAYANVAAGTKRYLKLYNATVGNVTVGTTAPDMTFELDGTQGLVWSTPLLFSTALTVAATTGVADNDSGAPGANEVIFNCGVLDL